MIMVWETLKIQIWSLEKVNFCLVHYKKKSSDLVQVVLSTQSGFKSDLMQPMNSWQLLKELLINGSFKTVSQSVLPILCFQVNFNKKFNKIIRISWKNISNHSTFTEMKRLLKKKLSIKEGKRLSIHLTFTLTVSWTVVWEVSRKLYHKKFHPIWIIFSKWLLLNQRVLKPIWLKLCSVWVIKTSMVSEFLSDSQRDLFPISLKMITLLNLEVLCSVLSIKD